MFGTKRSAPGTILRLTGANMPVSQADAPPYQDIGSVLVESGLMFFHPEISLTRLSAYKSSYKDLPLPISFVCGSELPVPKCELQRFLTCKVGR